jgi:ABC-type glycerol-3-phosphate transport system substrate-binding protein
MNQSKGDFVTKVAVIVGFLIGVLGIIVFAASNFSGSNTDPQLTGTITIWGTLPEKTMSKIVYEYSQNVKTYTVKYVEVPEANFYNKFVEATARGTAPDVVLAGENVLFPLRDYFTNMPPDYLTETTYKSVFARPTYKLYGDNGTFMLPLVIDPLVMFTNTNILINSGYTKPPEYWIDLPIYVKSVLDLNKTANISETKAIAMGTFTNVTYAKELIETLLLQLQNGVVNRYFSSQTDSGGKVFYEEKFESLLGFKDTKRNIDNSPNAQLVFNFFVQFINPNLESYYSWSRRAPQDRDLFAAGNLGLYFGLASDKSYIDIKNPNLRYEIALVPIPKASEGSYLNVNYAKVYGLAVAKKATNQYLAQKVITDLTDKDNAQKTVDALSLAPARADLLSEPQSTVQKDVIYKAASKGDFVLEPKKELLRTIFDQITESFAGSRLTPVEIITKAQDELSRQVQE